MSGTMTTEEFIRRAKAIHGDRYCYRLTKYVNSKTPFLVECEKHGVIKQHPSNHLKGNGCRKCGRDATGRKLRHTGDEFIEKAKKIHGDKYGYDECRYVRHGEPVLIRCHKHGLFSQMPAGHLSSNGCPKCGSELKGSWCRYDTDKFVQLATQRHGERYDYSRVEYVNSQKAVEIICRKHGPYMQAPNSHLAGRGCARCGRERQMKIAAKSVDDFISQARMRHGDLYDYSLVQYKSAHKRVEILCRSHGAFWQKPDNHLAGNGCPTCKASTGESAVRVALEKAGVPFVAQWTPGIPEYKRCSFDFLVDERLLIEFDGIQHFEPRKRFGGVKEFTRLAERDLIKTRWAIDHGYKLLRIPYTRKHEVASIVNEAIEELGLCQVST